KFARRNKVALMTASVVASAVLLAVAGLAVSTMLVWRANQELRRNLYYQYIALAEREWSANKIARHLLHRPARLGMALPQTAPVGAASPLTPFRRCAQRGFQPRWPVDRLRQPGRRRYGLGSDYGTKAAGFPGPSRARAQCGVQPRRAAPGHR